MFLGHDTDFILAGFCIETFDGRKWQRQNYFSLIFGILAQFLNLIAIDIAFQARGQNFSSVKAEVVAPGSLFVNQHAACDVEIS